MDINWEAVQLQCGIWIFARRCLDGRVLVLASKQHQRNTQKAVTTARGVNAISFDDTAGFLSKEAAERAGERVKSW